MKKWNRSRFVAFALALACGASMLAGVRLMAQPQGPTLHVEGLRLQNVDNKDGTSSIQALVDIYVEYIPKLSSVSLALQFDSRYWQPSHMDTNKQFTGDSVITADFFEADPDLYSGTDEPFRTGTGVGSSIEGINTGIDLGKSTLFLNLNLKTQAELPDLPGDRIEELQNSNNNYIDAENDKVRLGTLSFWVDPDNLPEMTQKAEDMKAANPSGYWSENRNEDYVTSGKNDLLFPVLQPTQASIPDAPKTSAWTINFIDDSDVEGDIKITQYDRERNGVAITPLSHLHQDYTMPYQVIRVEAAEKEVEINAYQAFTDGTPADFAATLQRYSSAARLTYPNGDQRDEAMFWGNDVMTVVDNNSGRIYEFHYDSLDPKGYTFVEVDAAGTVLNSTNAEDDYDPTHNISPLGYGDYTIKQPYTYEENGDQKTYPTPITVHLKVNPVKVIDVVADDLTRTYLINDPDLPQDCPSLELPTEGRLVFDTVLSGTIPTLPLTTWTNGTSPVLTLPVTDMHDLSGLDGMLLTVFWPVSPADIAGNVGVGEYQFNCADPTQAAIQAVHPWATVDTDYTIDARRIIRPDNAVLNEYIVTADVDDALGIQTLTIKRKDGAPMMTGTTFEVYRPDGVKVEPSWFASNAIITAFGGAFVVQPNGILEYNIYTYPGRNPSTLYPNSPAERETCRRHINLGGYFTVVVHETGLEPSDPIRAYQRRRQNIYMYSYDIPTGGTLVPGSNYEEFDFTGNKAGIYPFHLDSTLPDLVVLPLNCGYEIETRYDGVTGAEPGTVRSFAVDSWLGAVQADPSGKTAPSWTAGDIVTYGAGVSGPDTPFSDHSYGSAFGMVENPNGRVVHMKVEPDDVTDTPVEKLLLTYEGAPAPSNILKDPPPDEEVNTVVFDSKEAGYPYKQEFELTLTNAGTTDIHGIYVDALLGPSMKGEGQHFEIIKPPATDLAPGASTTFIISYILGLEPGTYVDDIYVGTSGGTQKTFIARFRVVEGKLYRLTIQPRPEDGSMGNGGTVTGVVGGVYDPTPMGNNLLSGDPLWVKVTPTDEYAIKELTPGVYEVYYFDETGTKIYLNPWTPSGPVLPGPGEFIFELPGGMPARNTTIFVDFYEPIPSKLRLHDLEAYASPLKSDCITDPRKQIMYDMTDLTYGTTGFDPDHEDYLVVIPADAEYSGLELTLYDIVVPYEVISLLNPDEITGGVTAPVYNQRIQPNVHIQLDDPGATVVLDRKGWIGSTSAADNGPVTSAPVSLDPEVLPIVFESPDPGEAKTATITITYYDGVTFYQRPVAYKVKFVRRTEVPIHTFGYGNTPYGLIMNAANILDADKQKAKDSYNVNDRFVDPTLTPRKATVAGQNTAQYTAQDLTNYVYWPEAWEPEDPDWWPEDWGERNLDRNDCALVVYAGQAFDDPGVKDIMDSTGSKVTGQLLSRTVEVTVLDDNGMSVTGYTPNTTADKFNGIETAVIELGGLLLDSSGKGAKNTITALSTWEATEGKTIRPGIYALKYEFEDFDGTKNSFTRPLVILSHLGDVDADKVVGDEEKTDDGVNYYLEGDIQAILKRFIELDPTYDLSCGLAYEENVPNYPDRDKAVYRYRICDVNNDRNINNIDANRIQSETTLTDYYRPVDYIG